MSSNWSYAPITIHLENEAHSMGSQPLTHPIGLSGIYIANQDTKNHYFISINDIPTPERCRYQFSSPQFITTSTITWVPLILTDIAYLRTEKTRLSNLSNFIRGLIGRDQFKYKPHIFNEVSVLVLKLPANIKQGDIFDQSLLTPIWFIDSKDVPVTTKTKIQCCPFSLTNAAIFSNYQLFGQLNYKIGDAGYFTDVKYLDDIIGGVVNIDADSDINPTKSIGLIIGTLSKNNGDGELMTIIAWNKIFELLGYLDLKLTQSGDTDYLPTPMSLTSKLFSSPGICRSYDPRNSIVRISITSDSGRFWGSGIMLTSNYIITNLHVLKMNSIRDLRVSTPGQQDLSIALNDVIPIRCPLTGFDLCFLKLRIPEYSIPSVSTFNSFLDILRIGQSVHSIGYGLFHTDETTDLKPLRCEGKINNIVTLDIEGVGAQINSLLLVSASCWNGSSGGGLFNQNNQLIGIMTSNGKLSSGEILPNFTLAIPINIIEKALHMIINNIDPINVETKVKNVWALKNTHQSIDITDHIPNKL